MDKIALSLRDESAGWFRVNQTYNFLHAKCHLNRRMQ